MCLQVDTLKGTRPDVMLHCVEDVQHSHAHDRNDQVTRHSENSVFCLVMSGKTQTARSLSEAFLAGCIPVFVGPPFHGLPYEAWTRFSAGS